MTKEYDMVVGSELPHFVQQDALSSFVHRFTGEHIPAWSKEAAPNGRFYAPQYRNDQEWLQHTLFAVNTKKDTVCLAHGKDVYCQSNNPTWPWGQWLDNPFSKGFPSIIAESSTTWSEP